MARPLALSIFCDSGRSSDRPRKAFYSDYEESGTRATRHSVAIAPISPGRPGLRGRGDARDQNRENPGQEYSVEGSGAADRGDRRAKAADLVQVEQIGADQGSHRAADIGERRRIFPG